MTLTLSPRHRSRLTKAASDAYPEECCGVLLGHSVEPSTGRSAGSSSAGAETLVERLVPARNVSRGDRRREYVVDPRTLVEAVEQARAEGWSLVGFYHSHPDGSRSPSHRDSREAWPDMSYVIVPRRGEMTSWRRRGGEGLEAEKIVERAVLARPDLERPTLQRSGAERSSAARSGAGPA